MKQKLYKISQNCLELLKTRTAEHNPYDYCFIFFISQITCNGVQLHSLGSYKSSLAFNTYNHRLKQMEKQAQSKKSNIIPKQITNQEVACVSQMKDKLNSKLGVNHDSYDIISISADQITGSTRYYHLRGKPGNKEYTVTINQPTGEKNTPIITQSCAGLKAHQEGFSQQEVQH